MQKKYKLKHLSPESFLWLHCGRHGTVVGSMLFRSSNPSCLRCYNINHQTIILTRFCIIPGLNTMLCGIWDWPKDNELTIWLANETVIQGLNKSTNVKLRLRFDIHLTFTWRSPDVHLTFTWPSPDLPLTLTRPLPNLLQTLSQGLVLTSHFMFDPELDNCLTLCRW